MIYYTCIHVYVYLYVYLYVYVYVYVCMHVCMYVYIYIYIFKHTHTYMLDEEAGLGPSSKPTSNYSYPIAGRSGHD